MFAIIRRRATFANICSFLALTIVLSMGTAYAANTVRSKDIVNGQVKNQDLGTDSVDSSKVADGTLGVGDLGSNSVGSDELQSDSVNALEIADSSIDGGEIVNESMTSNDLASNSVGSSEVVDGSMSSSDLGTGSVGSSEIIDGSVTGTDIASSTITGSDVASNSISTADLVGTDASGAINLGSGSVAQGRCNFYSIGVPGALIDQTVIISTRNTPPAGVILYGVDVPANDTVTMAACNFTGGTFPSLSSFPIRTVTFG